jgi:hypothetical protein
VLVSERKRGYSHMTWWGKAGRVLPVLVGEKWRCY